MDKFDGNITWMGGMDAARPPWTLEATKYARGCNVMIQRQSGELTNRCGFEQWQLVGDAACLYECAKNFQAAGHYLDGNEYVQLKMVDGWILSFRPMYGNLLRVEVLNQSDRRSAVVSKGWITTVPGGAIVQDGDSLPHFINESGIRRSKGLSSNEVTVGRMGIYCQNRYFYVDASGRLIRYSDPFNPYSIRNSVLINIQGFALPEDQGQITAIGLRTQNLNYVEGGTLSFASLNSIYSVDVRGDAQDWEQKSTNVGKVQEALPGLGAASSYSYEEFSSNLYFRTLDDGVADLAYSEQQYRGGMAYTSVSAEFLEWFGRDSKVLLGKCHTKRFGHRLLTTVGPQINRHGYVYWSGLTSFQPTPSGQSDPIYEGLWTGVRPWALTGYDSPTNGPELWVDSYDRDGQTRLYKLNIRLDRDKTDQGYREIESWLETRAYHFSNIPQLKTIISRSYTLSRIPRDLEVEAYSRREAFGEWEKFYERTHYVARIGHDVDYFNIPYYSPIKSGSPQQRVNINIKTESTKQANCYARQYRFHFKGAYTWASFYLTAEPESDTGYVDKPEKNKETLVDYKRLLDYTYYIR